MSTLGSGGRSLSLQSLARAGVTLTGRMVDVVGHRIIADDTLAAKVAAGDASPHGTHVDRRHHPPRWPRRTAGRGGFGLTVGGERAGQLIGQLQAGAPIADVRTEASGENETQIVISGEKLLPFAFQAVQLRAENGIFVGYSHVSGSVGFASPVAGTSSLPLLLLEDDLVETIG